MIITDAYLRAARKATVTITDTDGSVRVTEVIDDGNGWLAGMARQCIGWWRPNSDKRELDAHIDSIRASYAKLGREWATV